MSESKGGAPLGNTNAARKNRMFTDCLRRELTQNPDDVLAITRKVIELAKAGEQWATTLAYERMDGKVPVAVVGGDEDENPLRHAHTVEWVNGQSAAAK